MSKTGAALHPINRVAVLGAGAMGAQIAALIAARGVDCDLFDLSAEMVEDSKRRLLTMRPRVIDDSAALDRVYPGSFDNDLNRLAEADWVIEAIIERPEPKLELWRKASRHVRHDAVMSTNTSGIPITMLAKALPDDLRNRFLGTHFFNPPRYLRLLELIPTGETDPAAVAAVAGFAEETLEKGIVIAKDVPGFITNRIGCFYFLAAMRAADEFGLTPDRADALSGPLMGRSNSATYRTIDLVGVDVLLDICDNTRVALDSPEERQAFTPPEYLREMRRRNWLGNKSGQGFYKRTKSDGKSRVLALDPHEMRYAERQNDAQASLTQLNSIGDTAERMRALVASDNAAGRFAWRTLSQLLAFSAAKVGEVADDIVSIDRAMRWGFNWEMGPFETWDALGVEDSITRMEADGLQVPDWVKGIGRVGHGFYRSESNALIYALPSGKYKRVQR